MTPRDSTAADADWRDDARRTIRSQYRANAVTEWAELFSPVNHRPIARYVMAESLAELGRVDEARGWHGSWQVPWGTEFIWKAPAAWRLGQILEQDDPEAALNYYKSFTTRWRNADPGRQARVSDVQRRIASLTNTGQ